MTANENNLTIVREITEDGFFHAIFYDNGVIELVWDKSVETIEIEHLDKAREAFKELGGGKEMPIYFSTHEFLHVSDVARKHAATKEYTKYTLANAVYIDSLAMRILLHVFNTFNKPTKPTKGFENRDNAIKWLLSFKE